MTPRSGLYTFIGEDKSLGYRNGRVYALSITVYSPDNVRIAPVFPHLGGQPCPYESVTAFYRNWVHY